jgi:hypothetical protein
MASFVSLGSHCQAAYQIRRVSVPRAKAQFFDWLVTPHDGLIALLQNRFGEFLTKENLLVRGAHGRYHDVVDVLFGIKLLHDFPRSVSLADGLSAVQQKYRVLAGRFLALPHKDLIFIRHVEAEHCCRSEAEELHAVLATHFGRDCRLIIASDQLPSEPWHIQGVKAFQLAQPKPYIWRGLDAAWDALFSGALDPKCASVCTD